MGAFGLLDFTRLRPVLAWHALRNLRIFYLSNFPILFLDVKPRILNQWIRGHDCMRRVIAVILLHIFVVTVVCIRSVKVLVTDISTVARWELGNKTFFLNGGRYSTPFYIRCIQDVTGCFKSHQHKTDII
jgi:hypothetical protein